MATPRKPPKKKQRGKWVFQPAEPLTPEQQRAEDERLVMNLIVPAQLQRGGNPFAALDHFHDYFPDDNEVPEGGAWIVVKNPPLGTPYTVPPMSLWFAEPWAMESTSPVPQPKRVRVVTPRGDLGLFPREYVIIKEPGKFYEYIGKGMSIHFFSGDSTGGVPEMALFYLRSRGISKRNAITLLIGNIKSHSVCWMETDREVARTFVRDTDWPLDSQLATRPVEAPNG